MLNVDLKGKTALVIGGSRGIGAKIVEVLCDAGAYTVFTHTGNPKNRSRIDRLTEGIRGRGGRVRAAVSDACVSSETDELVRGVDIVGTPLTCFSEILCTADDADVFNGLCGAESGRVPVSAVSPSILVAQIEVEKKQHAQGRPPILDAPIASEKK